MPTLKGIVVQHPDGGYTFGPKKLLCAYNLAFFVKADTADQGPIAIQATTGLPKVGLSVYAYESEFDLGAVCKSKKAERVGRTDLWWRVNCSYDNRSDSQAQEDEDTYQSPLDRPYEIDWDSVTEEVALWEDMAGAAVVNSAGERFPEPVTGFITYPTVTVTRWEATFTATTILAYVNHVNDATWFGVDPGIVLCESIRARRVSEEGALLWQVTYRFKFSPLPWKHQAKVLDQGTYYLAAGVKTPFMAENVPYVGNLDGSGGQATAGSHSYITFERAPDADFDALGLV